MNRVLVIARREWLEQVRQPIYTGALGTWRRYEEHLDFWKEEMAEIIATLPESVRNAGL